LHVPSAFQAKHRTVPYSDVRGSVEPTAMAGAGGGTGGGLGGGDGGGDGGGGDGGGGDGGGCVHVHE